MDIYVAGVSAGGLAAYSVHCVPAEPDSGSGRAPPSEEVQSATGAEVGSFRGETNLVQGVGAQHYAELVALCRALTLSKQEIERGGIEHVSITIGSLYVYNIYTKYITKWMKNGFKTVKGSQVKYGTLIRRIYKTLVKNSDTIQLYLGEKQTEGMLKKAHDSAKTALLEGLATTEELPPVGLLDEEGLVRRGCEECAVIDESWVAGKEFSDDEAEAGEAEAGEGVSDVRSRGVGFPINLSDKEAATGENEETYGSVGGDYRGEFEEDDGDDDDVYGIEDET